MKPLRFLVVCCGNMGTSHARAYHRLSADFQIVGLVARGAASRDKLAKELGGLPTFAYFKQAYAATRPDVMSINTDPDTYAAIARSACCADSPLSIAVFDTANDPTRAGSANVSMRPTSPAPR
jgi:predicted dehydrogenase